MIRGLKWQEIDERLFLDESHPKHNLNIYSLRVFLISPIFILNSEFKL